MKNYTLISGASSKIARKIIVDTYEENKNLILLTNKRNINFKKSTFIQIKLNFEDVKETEKTVKKILSNYSVGKFINCAGNAEPYMDFLKTNSKHLDKSLNINFISPLIIVKELIKNRIKNNKSLIVVHLSSNTIKFHGSKNNLPYLTAKVAMEEALVNLSKEYASKNVRINIIRPGVIRTDQAKNLKSYSSEDFEKRIKLIPVQKPGKPSDISECVKYLISEKSRYVYGQIISVAGGD